MSLRSLARSLLSFALTCTPAVAISFTRAPASNLDLDGLGQVALAGNFDALSLYNWLGQQQSSFSPNGSQSLLAQYPDTSFAQLNASDASIQALCPFTKPDGSLIGIIVAGNFTSLGSQAAQAVALYDPSTSSVTPLPGLTGQVSSLYCDGQHQTVYFGGTFTGGNSSNAIAWTTDWTTLPFAGFNGPVNTITQMSNGSVIFGGSFTGLASSPTPYTLDAQVVNLVSANISSYPNNTNAAYVNGANIVCKTPGQSQSAEGNDWLLADQSPGFWRADFGFGFVPTKLRLYQSQVPNYGTKTWRFTALPLNGILNFTYTDSTGVLQTCTSQCPLPLGNNTAQDFHFVNPIGMNAFRIDVSDWWGQGAGLGGIELFQDDIFTYAINAYNEPVCDDISRIGSNSSVTGEWNQTAAGGEAAQYLTTYVANGTNSTTDALPSVTFYPDIKQSGNYTIMLFTPGCVADNTCNSRGRVNITGLLSSTGGSASLSLPLEVWQTNNNEKYDTVYRGYVEQINEATGFRPSITLTPSLGQAFNITVVAERVQFVLTASTGGLNGLYEYNPNQALTGTNFNDSAIDMAGMGLGTGAQINQLATSGSDLYVAGSFETAAFSNIMIIRDGSATSLPGGGLNQNVASVYQNGSLLFVGGNFTNTRASDTNGLNNVAVYDSSQNTWSALGAGVNGEVTNLVPLDVEVDGNTIQGVAVSGYFSQVNAFGDSPAISVNNLAVWVPTRSNWLQNLGSDIALSGRINAATNVPGSQPLFAGNVDSQSAMANSVSGLTSSSTYSGLALREVPVDVELSSSSSQSSLSRRATTADTIPGVMTGLFYIQNNRNVTVLGGSFSVAGSNGSTVHNLAFLNGTDNNSISGLTTDTSSTASILALDVQGSTLLAGGTIDGEVILFNLDNGTQLPSPPSLSGADNTVNFIAARPSSSQVYVGGSFESAGALQCPSLCVYDTTAQQWARVLAPQTTNVESDSVVNWLAWASSTRLIIAGNMTIGGNYSTLAAYDASVNAFTTYPGSGDISNIPGPITAFSAADTGYSNFFVAGASSADGSAFISRFTPASGSSNSNPQGTWTTVSGGLESQSVINSIQVMSLTESHDSTPLLDDQQTLLVTGQLSLQSYGNVSAALFDGTTFTPFALSTTTDGSPGAIRRAFVQNPSALLNRRSGHLAVGLVVLVGLAIALGLIFLVVVAGILAERIRRRREGYVRAPSYSPPAFEKGAGAVGDIGAEELFRDVGREGATPRL